MTVKTAAIAAISLFIHFLGVAGCCPNEGIDFDGDGYPDIVFSDRSDDQIVRRAPLNEYASSRHMFKPVPGDHTISVDTDLNISLSRILMSQGVDMGLYPEEDLGAVTVPRIAGRDTVLRAFVEITGSDGPIHSVTAELHGVLDGTPLPDSPVEAALGPSPESTSESDWMHSLNFVMPDWWTVPEASFYLVLDPEHEHPENDESDNRVPASGTLEFGFVDTGEFDLVIVPVIHNGRAPDPAAYEEIEEWILGTYPVPYVNVEIHAPLNYTGAPVVPNGENWNGMLDFVTTIRGAETSRPDLYYYGIFDPGYEEGVTGLAWVPYSPSAPYPIAVGTDRSPRAGKTAVHEIGHNHGRRHAEGCAAAAGIDPNYPYPGGSIGVVGWRPGTARLYDPAAYADAMSYCDDVWISDYNYRAFHDWDASLGSAARSLKRAPAERVYFLSGGIEGGQVVNPRAFDLQDHFETPDEGDHRLELLDVEGRMVASKRFAVAGTDRLPCRAGFMVKVDRTGMEVEGYRIIGPGERLLLTERRTGPPPWIEISSTKHAERGTSRIAWRESSEQELLRIVMVANERENRWEVLSFGIGARSFEWEETEGEGGSQRVRVIVSDGVRSDVADAAF